MQARNVPRIAELGHVGVFCKEPERQVDFYTRVLGLTLTDHDESLGLWFLSARPGTEHHELLLASGRRTPEDMQLIQQISFRCEHFDDLLGFYRRFKAEATKLDMIVSHGNAVGVYFFDPEGNRCEVYWQTGLTARQPFVEDINIETDPDDLLQAIRDSVAKHGTTGFAESSYAARTRRNSQSV